MKFGIFIVTKLGIWAFNAHKAFPCLGFFFLFFFQGLGGWDKAVQLHLFSLWSC